MKLIFNLRPNNFMNQLQQQQQRKIVFIFSISFFLAMRLIYSGVSIEILILGTGCLKLNIDSSRRVQKMFSKNFLLSSIK